MTIEIISTSTVRETRYSELGYRKDGATLWRIIDIATGCAVGPYYKSKTELLADLSRFAREYGCE